MFGTIISIALPILKWFVGKAAKKKLTDKEFVAYILAHQSKKGEGAGRAALDFEDSMAKALKEVDEMKAEAKRIEDNLNKPVTAESVANIMKDVPDDVS